MRISPSLSAAVVLAAFVSAVPAYAQDAAPAGVAGVTRVFRPARHTRGNTNVFRGQPIDEASWLWLPGDSGMTVLREMEMGDHPYGDSMTPPVFLRFRRRFEGGGRLRIDVSADERFHLVCDGTFVARGPNRAVVENWQYQTYDIDLKPGAHVLEATVWKTGDAGPLAQLSWRGGFVLKAEGGFDALLTTGKAAWEVGRLATPRPLPRSAGVWGTGAQWEMTGTGIYDDTPAEWKAAEVVRGPAGSTNLDQFGLRSNGWMLFPTQLPDQIEVRTAPGRVRAVARGTSRGDRHVFTAGEAAETLDVSRPFTVPANTRMQIAWDLGRYICAYPEVELSGGRGAKVYLGMAESARDGKTGLKGGGKGSRDEIVGRFIESYGDTFVSDGRAHARFSPPWFRCGKWCRIDVETADEPLTVAGVSFIESRYPLEMESAFSSPQDPSLDGIRRIGARAMQMCCHETLYDCPFYEQQMYPGDTRVQLNVISAMTADDRIIRRAIELYDLSTRDDGMCPFNWPTRGTQEGATYTLCYLCMFGDYAMNHADRDWLRARIPGLRKSMAGIEFYENAEGLLQDLPGWNFMDWVPGWRNGNAPSSLVGDPPNCEINLFWVLAMRSAALAERALGNDLQAEYWEAKSDRLKSAIVARFWSDERGMLSDTVDGAHFSEHSQCLALLGDVLPEDKAESAWRHLIADGDLDRTTVYFSYYLFETYFKFGRADLFLRRLDLWRTYVEKGLTTTQESPDSPDGRHESRSDCHAWGAHPIWFMQTGLAGIRSDAPFFARVRVAPCPGPLRDIRARHPHPQGWIEASLSFRGGQAHGRISTPVPGTFVYGGQSFELRPGDNEF